jgi:hypothetical protein
VDYQLPQTAEYGHHVVILHFTNSTFAEVAHFSEVCCQEKQVFGFLSEWYWWR